MTEFWERKRVPSQTQTQICVSESQTQKEFWDRSTLSELQLGLHKRRLWYNFSSYVGRTELCI